MDWSLQLVTAPVSDVDRAKAFYVEGMGFHFDHDARINESPRFVQLTPPGSPCRLRRGDLVQGARFHRGAPDRRFVFLKDPDGNCWSIQQPPGIQP